MTSDIQTAADIYNDITESFEVPRDLRETLALARAEIVRAWEMEAVGDRVGAQIIADRLIPQLLQMRERLIDDYIEDSIARREHDLDAYLEGME